jgi:hypothetical protein
MIPLGRAGQKVSPRRSWVEERSGLTVVEREFRPDYRPVPENATDAVAAGLLAVTAVTGKLSDPTKSVITGTGRTPVPMSVTACGEPVA